MRGKMADFREDLFAEICVFVVFEARISVKVVMSASQSIDSRVVAMIGVFSGTVFGVMPGIGIDVSAVMFALKFVTMLASSKEEFVLACEACSCSAATAWDGVLQA